MNSIINLYGNWLNIDYLWPDLFDVMNFRTLTSCVFHKVVWQTGNIFDQYNYVCLYIFSLDEVKQLTI